MLVRHHSRARSGLALTLSLGAHALLILLLIQAARIGDIQRTKPPVVSVDLFDVPSDPVTLTKNVEAPKQEEPREPSKAAPAQRVSVQPTSVAVEPLPAPAPPVISAPAPVVPLAQPVAPVTVQSGAGSARMSPAPEGTGVGGGGSGAEGDGDADGVLISTAQWIRKPTSRDWAFYYPKTAIGFRGTAEVMLSCKVSQSNRVEYCRVVKETPRGRGLGRAAITMASKFRVRPVVVNGQARYDLRVRIPLVLASPGSTR